MFFTRQPVLVFFPVLFFLLSAALLFPLGKKEEEPKEPRDTEWVLSVTAFDTSALPEPRKVIGDLLQRRLVDSLNSVSYRVRVSPEYAWYEGRAWARDQGLAGKALAAKREERDKLLYRGDPGWRYRRNLKSLEKEIKNLEEAMLKTEAEKPPVEREPVFHLAQENQDGKFSPPPEAGKEFRFCQDQKADAFLAGTVSEYYGRVFIALKLYAAYTDAYIYEDQIIFSPGDIDVAAGELSSRLTTAVSGSRPAEIAVTTGLPESVILINRSFAAQGELERRERPPGKVTVEILASGYESARGEAELKSGELTEIAVNLQPLDLTPVQVESGEGADLSLYLGAQYMGEAPLTLMLPLNRLEHLYAESPRGEAEELVFPVRSPGEGTASLPGLFSQNPFRDIFGKKSFLENNKEDNKLVLYTKPLPVGKDRVDRARRRYYWAWGGTWITGIAAWMLYGNFQSQSDALNFSPNKDMYDSAIQANYLAIGGIGLVSLAVIVEFIQMGRYIHTAGEDAPAVIK
ncbi:MAG: hypothetical protein LBR93_08975 [Treponema sp.]|nr:hypothetical protein [Treponema sp.]